MRRIRIKLLLLLVVVVTVAVGAVATPAEASTYNIGVDAFDYVPGRVACNLGLEFNVYFGANQYHGTDKGIYVQGVRLINYTGAPIEVTANFHNQGGYGGQGHREVSNLKLYNNNSYYWAVNTTFWFAPTSHTFSSTIAVYGFSCGGTWVDYILWHGH
jgi:hypothetical protein